MEYSIGDKIIFNKNYEIKENWLGESLHTTKEANGWVEPWLIGRIATITRILPDGWYYIDIPNTHGYDEALFSKVEMLVEL